MKKQFVTPEYMTIEEFDRKVYAFIDEQADLLVREIRTTRDRQKQQVEAYNKKLINH